MQLETILCEFGRICATENALMQLKTISCEFGRICATGNAHMQLETILCKFEWICATGNALCSWKRFYASLDKSVLQGILFSDQLLAGTPF